MLPDQRSVLGRDREVRSRDSFSKERGEGPMKLLKHRDISFSTTPWLETDMNGWKIIFFAFTDYCQH